MSVSKNGELLPEVKDVIAVIAEHQLVLETGHSSPEESLLLLAEGMTYGADGAGLANLAASIGTFGCTSLNSTTSWPLTHDKGPGKGHHDSGNLAIISVVPLRGHAADRRGA